MLLREGLVHFYVWDCVEASVLTNVVCRAGTKTKKILFSQKNYITEIKVQHTVGKRRSRGAK
jgi:hypothetical protein